MAPQLSDQAAVAALVNTWLQRSGLKQHVAAQKAGLTESQFYNSYKNPDPRRKVSTDPERALAIVRVFAGRLNERDRCTAAEALQFLRLTRFPLERYAEVQALFPADQWQHALADAGYIAAQPAPVEAVPVHEQHPRTPGRVAAPNVGARRHNLPLQLTRFIGRAAMLAEIGRLLRNPAEIDREPDSARLLTLVGVGGVGKTRLALHAASRLGDTFADGVWFVDLAPLADPALVSQVIASVLDLPEHAATAPLTSLTHALQSRHLLLILDNCEHLIDACAQVADHLLRFCPQLAILATSREALRIDGERCVYVPPLAVPDPIHAAASDELQAKLMDAEAVQMFVERARQVQPAFTLTCQNVGAVAQICRQLDGLPLAIELAAARVTLFSVEQLAVRLADRLTLLTTGARTARSRQQTLRASIDWSYDLLSEPERIALRRLAVFAGGWTVEAAEEVAACAVDTLGQLVQKSLVVVEHAGPTRYHLLATIQQYAHEKLIEAREHESTRTRHLHYCLRLAESVAPHLHGAQQAGALSRLEAEHDNLRAALAWATRQDSPTIELQLVGALYPFWRLHGHWSEGRERLMHALGRAAADSDPILKANVLLGAGLFALQQGDYPLATEQYNAGLGLYEAVQNQVGIADAQIGLGEVAWRQGQYQQAFERYAASLERYQAAGYQPGIALALQCLGTVQRDQGQYAAANRSLTQSLELFRSLGNKSACALTLFRLGSVAYCQGDPASARRHHEVSLALRRELGDRWGIAQSNLVLGSGVLAQRDYDRARAYFDEALLLYRELNDKDGLGMALNNLGEAARMQGDYALAVTYYTESRSLFAELGRKLLLAMTIHNLGHAELRQGNGRRAALLFQESLAIYRELDDHNGMALCLAGLADVATRQGQLPQACCLFGAAEALLSRSGHTLDPIEAAEYNASRAAIQARLTDAALAAAWAEGQALALEQAIALGMRTA